MSDSRVRVHRKGGWRMGERKRGGNGDNVRMVMVMMMVVVMMMMVVVVMIITMVVIRSTGTHLFDRFHGL